MKRDLGFAKPSGLTELPIDSRDLKTICLYCQAPRKNFFRPELVAGQSRDSRPTLAKRRGRGDAPETEAPGHCWPVAPGIDGKPIAASICPSHLESPRPTISVKGMHRYPLLRDQILAPFGLGDFATGGAMGKVCQVIEA